MHSDKVIEINHIKDRLTTPSPGGWADILINFKFADDSNKHVCEIQVMHSKMMLQRDAMGGQHDSYVLSRSIAEIFEFSSIPY